MASATEEVNFLLYSILVKVKQPLVTMAAILDSTGLKRGSGLVFKCQSLKLLNLLTSLRIGATQFYVKLY